MKLVKLVKNTKHRNAGEVIEVDDASAASLVKRGVAKAFDPKKDKATAVRTAPRRGAGGVALVYDTSAPAEAGGGQLDDATPAAAAGDEDSGQGS